MKSLVEGSLMRAALKKSFQKRMQRNERATITEIARNKGGVPLQPITREWGGERAGGGTIQ
jgi:hypothetical protein